jgi:hypothetical protein
MIPSDVSPELVLVDPELAARARERLTDPPATPPHPAGAEPVVATPTRLVERTPSHGRRGGTLMRTVLAASLTLNAVFIWDAFQNADRASSPPIPIASGSADPGRDDPELVPETQPPDRGAAPAGVSGIPGGRVQAVAGRPSLRWKRKPGATYYNVVLWRDGVRLLDLWPAHASTTIPREWSYRGVDYRLRPGTYLWFVFPGFGAKAEHRYGKPIASGELRIAAT